MVLLGLDTVAPNVTVWFKVLGSTVCTGLEGQVFSFQALGFLECFEGFFRQKKRHLWPILKMGDAPSHHRFQYISMVVHDVEHFGATLHDKTETSMSLLIMSIMPVRSQCVGTHSPSLFAGSPCFGLKHIKKHLRFSSLVSLQRRWMLFHPAESILLYL